jgi:hypothetical protein
MKQAHWIGAAVVLAVMVFGITFAMNYLGGGGLRRTDQLPPNQRLLSFEYRVAMPLEWERKVPGQYDFWFTNDEDEPITIGLDHKTCRCASVQAFVLPEKRRPQLLAVAGAFEGLLAQGLVLQGAVLAAGSYEALERGLDGKELLQQDEDVSATVPARAVGWVRLKWSGEQAGPQRLNA